MLLGTAAPSKEPLLALAPVLPCKYSSEEDAHLTEVASTFRDRFSVEETTAYSSLQLSTEIPENARALVIDNHSSLPATQDAPKIIQRTGRAFVRARGSDCVVGTIDEVAGYREYAQQFLGLDLPQYIQLSLPSNEKPNVSFSALQDDPQAQKILEEQYLSQGPLIIHPYIGSESAWRVAHALEEKWGHGLKMLAPLPHVTRLANNKNQFLGLVEATLGAKWAIRWFEVADLDACVQKVVDLAQSGERSVIRLSNGATGLGTRVFEAHELARLSRAEVELRIREWLEQKEWTPSGGVSLQVAVWEKEVLVSPSVHAWIPPSAVGLPIIEAVTDQIFGPSGDIACIGCCTTSLPPQVLERITRSAGRLTRVLQRLGYIGRCSFDVIVCGPNPAQSEIRYVECNGRWGSTTMTLTLLNRVLGDCRVDTFLHQELSLPQLHGQSLSGVVQALDEVLYRADTRSGWAMLYNVACIEALGLLDVIILGDSHSQILERLYKLRTLIRTRLS